MKRLPVIERVVIELLLSVRKKERLKKVRTKSKDKRQWNKKEK